MSKKDNLWASHIFLCLWWFTAQFVLVYLGWLAWCSYGSLVIPDGWQTSNSLHPSLVATYGITVIVRGFVTLFNWMTD